MWTLASELTAHVPDKYLSRIARVVFRNKCCRACRLAQPMNMPRRLIVAKSRVRSLTPQGSSAKTSCKSWMSTGRTASERESYNRQVWHANVWKSCASLKKRNAKKRLRIATVMKWKHSRMLMDPRSRSSKTSGTTLFYRRARMNQPWLRWNWKRSISLSSTVSVSRLKTAQFSARGFTSQAQWLRCRGSQNTLVSVASIRMRNSWKGRPKRPSQSNVRSSTWRVGKNCSAAARIWSSDTRGKWAPCRPSMRARDNLFYKPERKSSRSSKCVSSTSGTRWPVNSSAK